MPDPLTGGWSYANYLARLSDARGHTVGELRILSSRSDRLLLEAGSQATPQAPTKVEIVARFYAVEADGVEGLGSVWSRKEVSITRYYPKANLQIGFAFHKDPYEPRLSEGKDLDRFPQDPGAILYGLDLEDRATIDRLRALHYPFAKVRVRFNLNHTPDQPDTTPGPNPVGPEP